MVESILIQPKNHCFLFQKQKQVPNPSAISGYDCAKSKGGIKGYWSTKGPCPTGYEKEEVFIQIL